MNKRFAKFVSMVLVLIMALGVLPMSAMAGGRDGGKDWDWWIKPDPKPNCPEMTLSSADGGVDVTVDAPEGALPKGTKMDVEKVSDIAEIQKAVDKAEGISGTVLTAVDITFLKKGAEVQPNGEVTVTMSSDEISGHYGLRVIHIKDNGTKSAPVLEEVEGVVGSGSKVTFKADSFSVYAVIGGEGGEDIKLLTVEFYQQKGSEWDIVSSQAIRLDQLDQYISQNMDFVHDPGVPDITATQSFEGWAYETPDYDEDDHGFTVAEINEKIKNEKTDLAASSNNVTWKYYAKVYDVVFVTFHDQAGVVIRLESIHLIDGHGEFNLNLSYTPFKGGWAHIGWTPTINNTGKEPTYPANPVVYENGDTLDLAASIDLYPYLKEGYWLVFDNYIDQDLDGTSASFTSPVYYGKDETVPQPSDYGDSNNDGVDHDTAPYREGYTFGGWYLKPAEVPAVDNSGNALYIGLDGRLTTEATQVDEETGETKQLERRKIADWSSATPYTWGQMLTADTTVYAKWIPNKASYLVVYMVQNATDADDADVTNNTYSYYDSVSRDWVWKSDSKQESKSGDYVSAFTASSVPVNDTYLGTGDLTSGDYYAKTISKLGQYYEYSSKNTGRYVMVDGDGSAVLYVYYDRKPVTLNFYAGSYSSADKDIYYMYDSYDTDYIDITKALFVKNTAGEYLKLTVTGTFSSGSNRLIYSSTARFTTPGGTTFSLGDYTIYAYVQGTTSGTLIKSITGLYGSDISDEDLAAIKPDDGFVYSFTSGYSSGAYSYTMHPSISSFTPGTGYYGDAFTINYFLRTEPSYTAKKTLHQISQNPETGEWGTEINTGDVTDTVGLTIGDSTGRTFIGYNLSTDSRESSNGYVAFGEGAEHKFTFKYTDITSNDAYAYKALNTYNLVFRSKTGDVRTVLVRYSQKLAQFEYTDSEMNEKYLPTDGGAGYYFDGWYADEAYRTPFNFAGKMPAKNVTVYAKWVKMRFRVVLDYFGGDPTADVTFPANQSSTFRVDYGEKIRDTAIQAANREGYTLLGWYLDKKGDHPFNFGEAITDETYNMDFSYVYGTGRTGSDLVTGKVYNDDELDGNGDPMYENVIGKITIYALWRQNSVGSDGIRVRYDAIEGDGYFPVNGEVTDPRVIIRDDPNIYTDHAKAFTQVASTPEDQDNYRFLYWVVMQPVKDAQGNQIFNADGTPKLEQTQIKVYPGQTFTVDYNYTVKTDAVKVTWNYMDSTGANWLHDVTTVTKGAMPQHSEPSGYISGNKYYPFDHWDPTIAEATVNTAYTAVYGEGQALSNVTFTVTWVNYDDSVLEVDRNVAAGTTPTYNGATPTRPASNTTTYTFSGWSPEPAPLTGDTVYRANYAEADRNYSVTFNANGGSFSSGTTQTVNNITYGTTFDQIFPATNPTRDKLNNKGCYFLGWYTAATGGTNVSSSDAFDGTVDKLYAHWYQWGDYSRDTSGAFVSGYYYVFYSNSKAVTNNGADYITGASLASSATATGSSGYKVADLGYALSTQEWCAGKTNNGSIVLYGAYNSGEYYLAYDDGDAVGSTEGGMPVELVSAGSNTYYIKITGYSYYLYRYSDSYYEWRSSYDYTNYRTAFTIYRSTWTDINAGSGTQSTVAPKSGEMRQGYAKFVVPSFTAPVAANATRGNTQPVKATTDKYEQITVGTTGLSAGKYLLTYTNTYNNVCVVTPPEMYDGNNYVACSDSGNNPTASGSYYTFSKDMSSYLFTITGDVSSWKNENGTYLATGSSATYTTYSATPETWTWNGYRLTNSNNYSLDCYSVNLRLASSSSDTYTLYKLVEDGGEEPTTSTLDEALNVDGGTLHFTTSTTYPWTVPSGQSYAQSGNAGVHSSTSDLYLTLEMQAGDTLSFKYFGYGEKSSYSSTYYDYLNFLVNSTENSNFGKVCESTGFETFTFTAPSAGTYSFTWRFTKDSSTSNSPDCGRIDDVTYTPTAPSYTITWNFKDANGADASTTSTVQEGSTPAAPETIPASYTKDGVTYTLTGWTPEIEVASETSVKSYTAEYTETAYTITWSYKTSDGNDTSADSQADAGTVPAEPAIPQTYTAGGTTYRFTGWNKTVVAANEATTYTAQYEVQSYTITWRYKNASGQQISRTTEAAPGAVPAPGFTPANYTVSETTYYFKGWTPEIVAAVGPKTYTAQYDSTAWEITWHYQIDGDDQWTAATTTVADGAIPSYGTHPVWTDGNGDEWMFSGWATTKNGEVLTSLPAATANAEYWATYTKVGVYTYTMYLYAVYGIYNKSGTHVTWFGNNDPSGETAGVSVERDKGMTINFAYDIPTPESFVNGVVDYSTNGGSKAATGLSYNDHVFLGWARQEADPNDTNNQGEAKPNLDEDDLWLKWNSATGKYLTKNKSNKWVEVEQIAADEMTPYQDMYAVWADVFYVYHSGTNEVERIVATRKSTYNLSAKTAENFLYGGYYTGYAGTSASFTASTMGWSETAVAWNGVGTSTTTLDMSSWNQKKNDTGAVAYNGGNITWATSNAYKTEPGNAIRPVAGTTYYIKEVPNSYLAPYLHYTYKLGELSILNAWLISAVDDKCYDETGFIIVNDKHPAKIATQLTVTPANGTQVTLKAHDLFHTPDGASANRMTYLEVINKKAGTQLLHNNDATYRYWKTPDGLYVFGEMMTTYTGIEKQNTIKCTSVGIKRVITADLSTVDWNNLTAGN